jgi:hypothetical protein
MRGVSLDFLVENAGEPREGHSSDPGLGQRASLGATPSGSIERRNQSYAPPSLFTVGTTKATGLTLL